MGKVVVISGTDTEVGKTFCGAALAACFRTHNYSVVAVKPVESGVGIEVSPEEDGPILAEATGQPEPLHALQRLRAPLAPPDAADLENATLDYTTWLDTIRSYQASHDVVLVEGAGGLLSPLTWNETALSMARDLSASVVVVASDRLGTLNHSLLTMHALETSGIRLDALVFSAPSEADRSTGRNSKALARFTNFRRIQTIPPMGSWRAAMPLMDNVVRWILADESHE